MQLINIKHNSEQVSFRQAVLQGLGRDQGLFFPREFNELPDLPDLLQDSFVSRSVAILHHLIGDEVSETALHRMISSAFDFPLKVPELDERVHALELFHGPSLAFKDFGARFMARCLAEFHDGGPMTILTATSGDTGAAVAHAYFNQPGINVVILYPRGKISLLQEKLFCTLGGNVTTIAVESDFDTCQQLVKQSFEDEQLRLDLGLNSANSINMARLLAQVCYYFEAGSAVPDPEKLVLSVPSGNFGNVTAGLIARRIGLPFKRIIAATNINDTVPRFLASGHWDPNPTVATITNAMDISLPNNFPRVLEMGERHGLPLDSLLSSTSLDDDLTREAIRQLYSRGYLADPHTALAWAALEKSLRDDEHGVFLCTAHPAKFLETLEETLGIEVPLPPELEAVKNDRILSSVIPGDFESLKKELEPLRS
ncbi:MAG: threonine synthase [Xanthomonadales bacterium]|nr:threonine synthase [Gammaproteobacteria bacterium]MBT8052962.1 threonine synthase [Gammaproteobacteria bacterium]NND57854.1 threonine synthase [Xanthomonadales bacterium]NNK50734.1 threonine synthase [Xanthomonadales bacterium]